MSARFFAVASVLLLAFVLNVVLLFLETVPEPVGEQAVLKREDPLVDKPYKVSTRLTNFEDFGLPESVRDQTLKRIEKLADEDIKNRQKKSFYLQAIRDSGSVAGVLCPGGPLPQRYAAAQFLIEQKGTVRQAVNPKELRQKLEAQLWYDQGTVRGVYEKLELSSDRPDDATALGIAVLMLAEEEDVITGTGRWGGGLFGRPSIDSYLRQNPGLEDELINYFAMMHLFTEIANEPRNEFCGVRRRDAGSDEETP